MGVRNCVKWLRRTLAVVIAGTAVLAGVTTLGAPSAFAAGCNDWYKVTPTVYTYRPNDTADASIRLQARMCRSSAGRTIKYVRVVACNHRASGKSGWYLQIYRDNLDTVIFSDYDGHPPSAKSCRGYEAKRAYRGHSYRASMSVNYSDGHDNGWAITRWWSYS